MRLLWHLLAALIWAHCSLIRARPSAEAKVINVDIEDHVNRTCLTSICNETVNIQHVREVESFINPTADPCENFHEYACGHWQAQHKTANTMMDVAHDLQTQKLVQLLEKWFQESTAEEIAQNHHHHHHQRAIKEIESTELYYKSGGKLPHSDAIALKMLQYYKACKQAAQADTGLKLYFEQIREMGLWPSPLHQGQQNWLETLATFGRYGFHAPFLNMRVQQSNTSYHGITILPHNIDTRLLITNEIYDILREYTSKSMGQLQLAFKSLEMDLAALMQDACEASGLPRDADNECDLLQNFTLQELQNQSSGINWAEFLESQLNRKLDKNVLITVEDLKSVGKIASYLNQANSELLSLYILTSFLVYLNSLPHNLLEQHKTAQSPSERCVLNMRKSFFLPMNWIYEQSYYSSIRKESDAIIRQVFSELKAEMLQRLQANRLHLNEHTLQFLTEKLRGLRLNIGNLPEGVSAEFYQNYIANLNVTHNFYYNHLNALQHFYDHQRFLSELPQLQWSDADFLDAPTSRISAWHSFHLHPPNFSDQLESSPYYYCLSNIIVIPHAYLQTPFYDAHFWPSLMYGDLATTLGHELIHAFDSSFSQYDRFGNPSIVYQQIESNRHYQQSVACLEKGTAFLSERIADISGTRLALNAFLHNSMPVAAVSSKTNARLFFIQFAQFFCGGVSDYEMFKTVDPYHDLDSLRLNHTLAHMPEFAEAFECKAKSAMNPESRCELW